MGIPHSHTDVDAQHAITILQANDRQIHENECRQKEQRQRLFSYIRLS